MKMKHWQDAANLVLGLWLAISPWLIGYEAEAAATSNAVVVGVLVMAFASLEFFKVAAWEEWTSFGLGVWLAMSPWLLGFNGTIVAMYNALVVGVIIAALALWTLGTDRDIGGWWSKTTRTQ